MKGRKPKPSHLKVISGNPGKRPITSNPQPKPFSLDAKPPKWIGKYGQELWQARAPELIELGILTRADLPMWSILCCTWNMFRKALEILNRDGLTTVDERGLPRKNPIWTLYNSAAKDFSKLAQEFGMTPVSRQRLDVRQPVQAHNPWEDLVK